MYILSWRIATCSHNDIYVTVWHFHIDWCPWKSVKSTYRLPFVIPCLFSCCWWSRCHQAHNLISCPLLSININLFISKIREISSFIKNTAGMKISKTGAVRRAAHSYNGPWFLCGSQRTLISALIHPLLIFSISVCMSAFVLTCIGIHITCLGVQKAEQAFREKHSVDESRSISKPPIIISDQTGNPKWFPIQS